MISIDPTGPPPSRVVVTGVEPVVDKGRLEAKASLGEPLVVEADVFAEGHDLVSAGVWLRPPDSNQWREHLMRPLGNDRWRAEVNVDQLGVWQLIVKGWVDHVGTWARDTSRKLEAGRDCSVELEDGALLLEQVIKRSPASSDRDLAVAAVADLRRGEHGRWLADPGLRDVARRWGPRQGQVCTSDPFPVRVDPARARFSSWYELFPRSRFDGADGWGSFRHLIDQLPRIESMGFDVLYLPPIHPVGRSARKGRNNRVEAEDGDVGSPWAIGAPEGGHDAIDPILGTEADLRELCELARQRGIDLALDLAFQCSPDHPWISEHPTWFRQRSDGSIKHAENPPKVYQDIVPLDFESPDWWELWQALHRVVERWIEVGIHTFRVDNPHTKPFPFWEWLIGEVKGQHPDIVFLSEAFTRPRVMEQLAKIGFSQSYTYFTWRQTAAELKEYLTELTTETIGYFRPNAWPNTPDILTEQLQEGGRPAFITRAVLASLLFPNWGVYGPAFELVEREPARPGSEEYLDSEKYQLRSWQLDRRDSLEPLLGRLNGIRRKHPSLQHLRHLHFHPTSDDRLLCWSRYSHDGDDRILVVVNLDPHNAASGMVDIDWDRLGRANDADYELHDLRGGGFYQWHGSHNYVELDPSSLSAHVFSVSGPPAVRTGSEGLV
jgi:starch synthase (maltosyl-transferring)